MRAAWLPYAGSMSWKTIRLELAAAPGFPKGSVSRGYFIRVPLNGNGSIDQATLAKAPQKATIRRFWSTDPDESGSMVRVEDKLVFRCNSNRLLAIRPTSFEVGGEVSVIDTDGTALPFRVAGVRHLGRSDQQL